MIIHSYAKKQGEAFKKTEGTVIWEDELLELLLHLWWGSTTDQIQEERMMWMSNKQNEKRRRLNIFQEKSIKVSFDEEMPIVWYGSYSCEYFIVIILPWNNRTVVRDNA